MVKLDDGSSIVNHQSSIIRLQLQPNPIRSTTNIIFKIPQDETVSIVIYDILGKEVKRIEKEFQAGRHKIEWTGDDKTGQLLSNGLYHIRMIMDNYSTSLKAILVK